MSEKAWGAEFTFLPSKEYIETGILTRGDIDFINEFGAQCDTCSLNHENQSEEESECCSECSKIACNTCYQYYSTEAIDYAVTLRKKTDLDIRAIKTRILEAGKDNTDLLEKYAFFDPETFWNEALKLSMCSQKEYDEAKKYYGEYRWSYG